MSLILWGSMSRKWECIYSMFDWDEENMLEGITKPVLGVSFYQYDASGERFYKNTGFYTAMLVNGHTASIPYYNTPTLYVSPYVVVNHNGYTKHYFIENERFASRIGDGAFSDINTHTVSNTLLTEKQTKVNDAAPDSIQPNKLSNLLSLPSHWNTHHTTYWQHSDHLGSASWVTDTNGLGYQHLLYMPWGEPLLDQRVVNNTYETRYTFSGKERDEETGYSYFGARYYNSDLSIWLSVDPMADKYPGVSPYVYCANNPVRLVDADGREISPIYDTQGCFLGTDDEGLTGKAIVMKKEDFKQGMSHKEALSKSLGQEGLVDDDAYDKLSNHYSQLKNRPDYDGIITDAEARSWWKNGNGQSLFVKQSMIDLSPVTTQDFKDNSKITHNFFFDATSNKDVGRVYGTLTLSLINAKTGEVKLGNPNNAYIDTYDFNSGGSVPRNIATWTARKLIGKGTPFSIYGWGRNPTVKVKN